MVLHKFRFDAFTFFYLSLLLAFFLFFTNIFYKDVIQIFLSKYDVPIVGLILWVGISSIWATSISLVWIQFFSHLQLFLILIVFRSLWRIDLFRKIIYWFYISLLFIVFLQVVVYSIFNSSIDKNPWNYFFGANENYVSSYCLALILPLLVYAKRNEKIITQFACFIFAILILTLSSSLGSAIGFFLVVLILYGSVLLGNWKRVILILIAFKLVILIIYVFFIDKSLSIEYDSRLQMIKNSFYLFCEHPLIGIGAGNWKVEAYKFMPTDVLNDYHRLSDMGNHNLYSMVLSELGLIGIILFCFSILTYFNLSKNAKSTYEISAVCIVLFYLVCCCFYQAVWHYSINFSKLEVIAFCSLGILSSNKCEHFIFNRFIRYCLVIVSFTSILYFFYFFETSKVCRYLKQNPDGLSNKVDHLEKLYSSLFFNSCYRIDNLNHSLGSYYESQGDFTKAELYYREAYKSNPFDYNRNLQIAEFMFYELNQKEESIEIVNIMLQYEELERANLLRSSFFVFIKEYESSCELLKKPSNNYRLYADLVYQEIFENEFFALEMTSTFTGSFISELEMLKENFKDLILNYGLNSKQAKIFHLSFKRYKVRFENFLRNNLSNENYINYLMRRYERYLEYEYRNISKLNDLDEKSFSELKLLISQYLIEYKLGESKVSKKLLNERYLKDIHLLGVETGFSNNIFNYY